MSPRRPGAMAPRSYRRKHSAAFSVAICSAVTGSSPSSTQMRRWLSMCPSVRMVLGWRSSEHSRQRRLLAGVTPGISWRRSRHAEPCRSSTYIPRDRRSSMAAAVPHSWSPKMPAAA